VKKAVLFVVISLAPALGQARIITVDDDGPADFNNIQAAIDDANNRDIVEIQPGRFTGPGNRDIDLKGKVITLRSSSGPRHCVIDCNGTGSDNHYGLYIHDNSGPRFFQPLIEGLTIANCYVQTMCPGGSAIRCYDSSPTIRNCIITNNGAELVPESLCFCYGGAVYIREGNPMFVNSILTSNWVGDWGLGGAICCDPDSTLTMRNCLVAQNTAGYDGKGGAIYCDYGGELNIMNCTIAHNVTSGQGGGICIYQYVNPIVMNISSTVIWGNWPDQIRTTGTDAGNVRYSDIEGGWPGFPPLNINEDPLFVDLEAGDYHIRWSSPCIDRGDPNLANDPRESDIDGEPRVVADRVDIGCDEVGPKQADFSRDGIINFGDYSTLIHSFAAGPADPNWNILADLYEDNRIDCNDLVVFTDDWLWIGPWHTAHP
jgi:predicted outer membrane repeat protein